MWKIREIIRYIGKKAKKHKKTPAGRGSWKQKGRNVVFRLNRNKRVEMKEKITKAGHSLMIPINFRIFNITGFKQSCRQIRSCPKN